MKSVNRFKSILLVHDDRTAKVTPVERAIELARAYQAKITVAGVIEDMPPDLGPLLAMAPVRDLQQVIGDAMKTQLDGIAAVIRRTEIRAATRLLSGTPFLEIIREALRGRHDLVMMAAEGRRRLKQMLFGSTTMHLLRKCPCPVWITHPGRPRPIRRILAAVDPKPPGHPSNALNAQIMEMAVALARMEKSELHVIHTWTLYAEAFLRGRSVGLSSGDVERLAGDSRRAHKQWLDAFLKQCDLRRVKRQVHLLEGEAAALIPETARKIHAGLIVMGTLTRAGIAGFLMGSTAERVLREVDCSVLTVKPKGFVTPVTL